MLFGKLLGFIPNLLDDLFVLLDFLLLILDDVGRLLQFLLESADRLVELGTVRGGGLALATFEIEMRVLLVPGRNAHAGASWHDSIGE